MANEIKTYNPDMLREIVNELGQPSFRAKQLYEWLQSKHAVSYDEMTNLPLSLRSTLAKLYPLRAPQIADKQVSTDGTRKYVLSLQDNEFVETVAIPSLDDQGMPTRISVCLSSQVGCSMGCLFCATGKEGFTRNLSSTEILDQLTAVYRDFSQRISSVVVMGQGEPFSNYDEVMNALRDINAPDKFNIGARRITLSTCGMLNGIKRLAHEPEQFTLAISLHSALQKKRNRLMPHMSNQPVDALKTALLYYVENTNRRVSLEYLLLKNVNDGAEDLAALIDFADGLLCHVNLLPFNKIEGVPFSPSPASVALQWENELRKSGIETTVRRSRGSDVSGACGQLKNSLR